MGGSGPVGGPVVNIAIGGGGLAYITVGVLPAPTHTSAAPSSGQWRRPARRIIAHYVV